MLVFEATGDGAAAAFAREPGGHRWQRVPPTERGGRRHTSTVTVAVLPVVAGAAADILDSDIEWQATRGGGKGGQAKQKTSNAVQMRHRPSGVSVRVESERSQWHNRESAKRLLAARIAAATTTATAVARASERRRQVGSGQRGDKVRTVRMQDGRVIDHRTGKRTSFARYSNGQIDDLF